MISTLRPAGPKTRNRAWAVSSWPKCGVSSQLSRHAPCLDSPLPLRRRLPPRSRAGQHRHPPSSGIGSPAAALRITTSMPPSRCQSAAVVSSASTVRPIAVTPRTSVPSRVSRRSPLQAVPSRPHRAAGAWAPSVTRGLPGSSDQAGSQLQTPQPLPAVARSACGSGRASLQVERPR